MCLEIKDSAILWNVKLFSLNSATAENRAKLDGIISKWKLNLEVKSILF